MDIVNETESRYLEILATGRKVLKKALHKYGEDTCHLTGDWHFSSPLNYLYFNVLFPPDPGSVGCSINSLFLLASK